MENSAQATQPAMVPPAPRQPSQRAYRLLFTFQARQQLLLIGGLLALVVGCILTAVFDERLPEEIAVAVGSRPATGHVTAVGLRENFEINGVHPTLMAFTYDAGGIQRSEISTSTDSALIAAAQPGRDVPIEVARLNPAWARITGANISVIGIYGIFILITPLTGLVMLFFSLRAYRRCRRVFIHGRPVAAKVIYAGPDQHTSINGRRPNLVRWEFSIEGTLFRGSVSSMDYAIIEPLMRRQELVALYDPDNPSINTVYFE